MRIWTSQMLNSSADQKSQGHLPSWSLLFCPIKFWQECMFNKIQRLGIAKNAAPPSVFRLAGFAMLKYWSLSISDFLCPVLLVPVTDTSWQLSSQGLCHFSSKFIKSCIKIFTSNLRRSVMKSVFSWRCRITIEKSSLYLSTCQKL